MVSFAPTKKRRDPLQDRSHSGYPGRIVSPFHPELAAGRWQAVPLVKQLANGGSEVERALDWAAKGNPRYSLGAFERGLELLALTLADPRYRGRLKEPTRLREVRLDCFVGNNRFGLTEGSWRGYFHAHGLATAIKRQSTC